MLVAAPELLRGEVEPGVAEAGVVQGGHVLERREAAAVADQVRTNQFGRC